MAEDRGRRLDELEFRAWRAFVYAYSTVLPRLDQQLSSAYSLSFNQFEVLSWLARAGRGGLRMSDLASRVVLSPSGVTRAVDQLEGRGLVRRCIFEGDKRGQLATITADGRTALRKATNLHVQGVRQHFLQHLGRSNLEQLARSMESILEGEGSPLPPLSAS